MARDHDLGAEIGARSLHADAIATSHQVTEVPPSGKRAWFAHAFLFQSLLPADLLPSRQRVLLFAPTANASIHREYIGVAHLLEIVGGQGRAVSAAAVKHERRIQARYTLLDVTLNDALAQVNCPGKVIVGIFALFPDVNQNELLPAVEACLDIINGGFPDALFGIVDDLQKTGGVLVCWDSINQTVPWD